MLERDLKIEVVEPPSAEDRRTISEGLLAHFAEQHGDPHFKAVGIYLRDGAGNLVGGLTARLRWGWMYVEMLWLTREFRGSGQGSRLLKTAESFARAHGGIAMHLECAAEARGFYERHGFEIAASMDGYPVPGERQHFMRKWLDPRGAEQR